MRAIEAQSFGDPSVLQIGEAARPSPDRGQVLVRLQFAGVDFADTERRRGLYRLPELPWIPGNEGAGIVEALGSGVDASWLGARVAFWSSESSGTYPEYAVAPAHSLFRVPRGALVAIVRRPFRFKGSPPSVSLTSRRRWQRVKVRLFMRRPEASGSCWFRCSAVAGFRFSERHLPRKSLT